MPTRLDRTDEELLASHETDDFGVFYDRHVRALLGYFQRRTGDPQVAADLTAETFASAIVAQKRYVSTGAPALAWLYRIASRRLVDYQRRGAVERKMQHALAMERPRLSGEDAEMIRLLADDAALSALTELPADQREAVSRARHRRRELRGARGRAAHVGGRGPPARLARAGHAAAEDRRARMSDFVTELRREVVGAHAQHRVSAVRTRRRRRRPILAGAVALAALLVAVVMVVRSIPQPEQTAEPRVVKVLRIGRRPVPTARSAAGSLWVDRLPAPARWSRIDPARRKVIARIPIWTTLPTTSLPTTDSVWASSATPDGIRARACGASTPASNRVASPLRRRQPHRHRRDRRRCASGSSGELVQTLDDRPSLAAADGRRTTRIPFDRGATGLRQPGRWVWVSGADGTVLRIDRAAATIAHRWPRLASPGSTP